MEPGACSAEEGGFLIFYFLSLCMVITLSVQEAQALMEKHKGKNELVLLDVRTAEEFAEEHLPRAVNIDIHADDFGEKIMKLDQKKMYLLHCHSGRRSAIAAQFMEKKGFTKVYNVVGLVFGR